jgi:O-antigen/teichoic acid export membrane protein
LYSTPNTFVNSLKNQLPVLYLSGAYEGAIVGFFGLALAIIKVPLHLIGQSIGSVFFAEAAHIGRSNPLRLKRLANKLIKRLALIGLFPLAALLLFGPELFELFFGSLWREAGVYARIISVMAYFELVLNPVSRVFVVFEKQKTILIINAFRACLIAFGFLISSLLNFDSYQTVMIYSCIMVLSQYIIFFFAQRIIKEAIELQNK